jgi:hypothetical protein
LLLLVLSSLLATPAIARPAGPTLFCDSYPDSPTCTGQMPTCKLCHTLTGPAPEFNDYGNAVFDLLLTANHDFTDNSFIALAPQAVLDAETHLTTDHDGDGISTAEEIALGTNPGNLLDFFVALPAPLGEPNPDFNVSGYDLNVAYQRMTVAFCGRSLSYDEKQAFAALTGDAAREAALHDALDACIRSDFWRNEALPQLADDRIKPIPRFEQWTWDFRLWRYANLPACEAGDTACGDTLPRSARDLLTADYHVRERVEGQLVQDTGAPGAPVSCDVNEECAFDEVCQNQQCAVLGGFQPLQDPTKRAGMVTTTWFHFFFTMFSTMPRTTAAQAYRAYLGVDFAKQQGLIHNPDEPADVDNKGVAQPTCFECHMHLDGATYPFAYYRGIEAGGAGTFEQDRPERLGLWGAGEDRQGFFFDQPVDDLVDWAQTAAASDFFKRNHTLTFFRYAVGREPRPDEADEFEALWRSMDTDSYETPALLHRLIDTQAFGGV